MYRNSYFYQDIPLGSSISHQDDIFKALREGEEKAKVIAGVLKLKIPQVTPGDIEIRCGMYDPQLWLDPIFSKKGDTMTRLPGQKTLKQMAMG